MNRSTGLVAALLVSGFVAAAEDAYFIQCTILDGNRVVGSPAVVAEPGKQVTVSVTDTYDLALTAEKRDSGRVSLSTDIMIAGETHSPELLLELDRPAEIRIGDTALRVTVSKFFPDDV
jgi:hypothetical protein